MFSNISKVGITALIMVVLSLLKLLGVEIPEALGAQLTEAVATIIGAVLLVWSQLKRPDLIAGIVRK